LRSGGDGADDTNHIAPPPDSSELFAPATAFAILVLNMRAFESRKTIEPPTQAA
jgi:hypothetical protein